MPSEQFDQDRKDSTIHNKHSEDERQPKWRQALVGVAASIALFNVAIPSGEAHAETPNDTTTAVDADVSTPTVEPTQDTPTPTPIPTPETITITTNTKLEIRTANVTGKHMDGYKKSGYNKRPYYGTWAERRSTLMKDITKSHPDILGLQEVDPGSQSSYIDSRLRGLRYGTKGGSNSRPIYWNKDKFNLVKGGTFSLKDTDGRRASYAILEDEATDQKMLVLNAHLKSTLNSAGNRDRVRSVKTLASEADILSDGGQIPIFITGDFNSDIGNDPYDTLRKIKNDEGIAPVEAHVTTPASKRINDKYNSANMYYKYTSKGRTKGQPSHMIIDQGWYYKTAKNDDGSVTTVHADKTYNDIPTTIHTKKHGAVRTTDHNPQTFYYTMQTKKSVTK